MTYLVCCQPKDLVYSGEASDDAEAEPTITSVNNLNRKPYQLEILTCRSHIDEIIDDFRPIGVVYFGSFVEKNCPVKHIETITLKALDSIINLESKLLSMRREALKLERFICSLKLKVLSTLRQ